MKNGLTKTDSLSIKGIAVLMLLFHHLYCSTDRFANYTVDFLSGGEEIIVNIAYLFKICVSIFAFITGYGLFKSISKTPISKKEILKWNITRLMKTMSGYWFIYLIAVIVSQIIDQLPQRVYESKNATTTFFYILNDFFGTANLFGTPKLDSTWWYMSAAIVFILLIPLLFVLSQKFGYLPLLAASAILPNVFNLGYLGGTNEFSFLMPVIFGMLFADYNLFDKIELFLNKNKKLRYPVFFILSALLIVYSYYISSNVSIGYIWFIKFGIVPLFFIVFLRFFIIRIPGIKSLLSFLGKHSMTIFLTHTFIREFYLGDFIYSFENYLLIYLVLCLTSTALALLLDWIKALVKYDTMISKMLSAINKKIDKA